MNEVDAGEFCGSGTIGQGSLIYSTLRPEKSNPLDIVQ